jgi:hypothetical protein
MLKTVWVLEIFDNEEEGLSKKFAFTSEGPALRRGERGQRGDHNRAGGRSGRCVVGTRAALVTGR